MTMKQINLSTITFPKAPNSKELTEPISSGAETVLSLEDQQKAIAFLKTKTHSMEVTTSLASSIESITNIPPRTRSRTLEHSKGHSVFTHVEIKAHNSEELNRVEQVVASSLVPLPIEEIKQRVATLTTLMTIPPNTNPDDLIVRINAISNELASYPADIVIQVIEILKNKRSWFPAWADFYDELHWRTDNRKRFMDAVHTERARQRQLG